MRRVEDELGYGENVLVSLNARELICVTKELAMLVCLNREDALDVLCVGHCSVYSMSTFGVGKL